MVVTAKTYHFKYDMLTLLRWCMLRNMSEHALTLLPEKGYLVYIDDIPRASVFLRLSEGGIGIIDGLMTDPSASSAIRKVAIGRAVELVLSKAKQLELKAIFAWTHDKSVLKRAAENGFNATKNTLISKIL